MSKLDLDSSNQRDYATGIQASLRSAVSGGVTPKPRSREMAPHLAYGRHRGPMPKRVRQAAVMVAIYRHPDLGWVVPLTLRPMHLDWHRRSRRPGASERSITSTEWWVPSPASTRATTHNAENEWDVLDAVERGRGARITTGGCIAVPHVIMAAAAIYFSQCPRNLFFEKLP